MNLELFAAFGDQVSLDQFKEEDTICTVGFSSDGKFLATGDTAGRVVVFQIVPAASNDSAPKAQFVAQFHAHKNAFDYFRSELCYPKVNALTWVPTSTINPLLLTCNSHETKLWKFEQQKQIQWSRPKNLDTFVLPKPTFIQEKYNESFVSCYTDQQTEYIVDLKVMQDQRSFAIIDVGCVKIWDMERPDQEGICLYRLPDADNELLCGDVCKQMPSCVITGDDIGAVRLLDMRQQAEDVDPAFICRVRPSINHKFPSCESVNSIAFAKDGNSFVVRTFGEAQVWDVRNTTAPISKLEVQWYPNQTQYLIEEEFVKDQFRTTITASGKIITGMYGSDFVSWDPLTKETRKHRAISQRTPPVLPKLAIDFTKRVTVCEAHPKEDIVVAVSTAALYLYYQPNKAK